MKQLLSIILSLVLLLSAVSCQSGNDEPISVTDTFYGCEFTITLDRGKYSLGDIGTVTASLVNKSGHDIKLYAESQKVFFELYFLEDDKIVFANVTGANRDITFHNTIPDGEDYVYEMSFDLGAPEGTQEPLKTDSEWKIKATANIAFDLDGEANHENISLEIIVPH